MIQAIHAFGGKDAGFDFLKKLQANNVGPSSSTGKLTALVNKGEIYVANGDLQMNMAQKAQNPNIGIFWPAGPDGKKTTFALPYYIALVKGAPHSAKRQEADRLHAFQGSAVPVLPSIAYGLPVRTRRDPATIRTSRKCTP